MAVALSIDAAVAVAVLAGGALAGGLTEPGDTAA